MATQRKKARGYVDANLYVADVESIALRNDGDETQPALTIKTRTGYLIVRCIGRRGVAPRFSDLRGADRKRRKATFQSGVQLRAGLVPVMTIEERLAERRAVAREAARDAREDR